MTPPSNKPLSSSGTTPSCDNYLLDLHSHVFPYRSPRPLTPPSLPPAPVYLSCWWTRDLTDFWGHFLETTSPRFSELLSSLCRRGNSKPTTALMTQWREQFKRKKTIDPLFPSLSLIPLTQPGPPHPPTPCPLPTLQSTHFPNWPTEQPYFPLANLTLSLPECCTHSAHHGILFPFSLHTTLCHFSPNCVCHAVQARLCCKRCRHIISLGPYHLSMTSYPSP